MKAFIATIIFAIESLHGVGMPTIDTQVQLSPIQQQEKIGHRYIKLSDQWILFPGAAIGYRSHGGGQLHGWDIDLAGYSYWDAGCSLYGKAHYLFYPTQKHFYLGLGAGVIGGYFSAALGGGPLIRATFGDGLFMKPTVEGSLGWEWYTKNKCLLFLQLELGGSYGEVPLYPSLSLGVGF